ncbi:MAG: GNAT family N-acetyltransferase [Planctomycetota bacterium]
MRPHLPALARLRIAVFREFPYLYDGDLAYEERYLRVYSDSPGSVFVLAADGERIVGVSTGLPLLDAEPNFIAPFVEQRFRPEQVFYFGESVLERGYRGRGIGVLFFAEREAHARRLGDFRYTTFCAVDRAPNHPRRPRDYVPLDDFWRKRGYERQPELTTDLSWRDLDESAASPKRMTYWLKDWGEV